MFCKTCGKEVLANAAVCTSCGCTPGAGSKFCANCGNPVAEGAVVCMKCGMALNSAAAEVVGGRSDRSRVAFILMAVLPQFLCCQFPFHNFYAGRWLMGGIQAAVWIVCVALAIFTGGASAAVTWPATLIWYAIEAGLVTTDGEGKTFK